MTLDGWDEIYVHMQVISGVIRSQRTLQRWAELEEDPLPVFDAPGGKGKMADSAALEAGFAQLIPPAR